MHTNIRAAVELSINDERVAVSDHIAYFWETEEEVTDAVRFQCQYESLTTLQNHGFDVKKFIEDRRMSVLGGKPSGTDMLAEIGGAFQTAMDAGAPLIRLLGNIGWGHQDWPHELDILEFGAKVTEACKSFPCMVVCMYDVRELSGRIMVHGAYETHPLTVCGNVLRENPHCMPIETFLHRNKKTVA